ncbi:MAG: hypothetical protein US11_C0002G0023 [Candidatus Roizmanbacteria bacterium GW2011_GWA2_36_23]|uniref:Glycosyltransferase RgtA/B/C/D-like domain-containing protein n=1 Tax=Candidatus Roizmanbacteria bacterium GW2011_GWA2_36_23 TaxID=1618480 RepID=A0A0G0GQ82_9BACT|nr:MAG: hypothetical protein US11_C0002G0023 [Candidatus Roizmanbacteria bacterium GW2011_GWA2_36_23]
MKKLKLAVTIFFIVVSLINVLIPIYQNKVKFLEKFDPKLYEKKYNNSQYVIPQSRTPISDEELVSYAGYRYATGMNPVLINSDHPPFGKYLIGWITILTGNNRIPSVIFGLANIIIIAAIIYFLTKSLFFSFMGVFFLSLDSMFIDQIIHSPILDIIQVFFILLYIFLFIIWIKKPSYLILSANCLILGMLASIKLYFPALLLLGTTSAYLILVKKSRKSIIVHILANAIGGFFTYTATYFIYFTNGNSFRNFLGTQKWIFLFWKNNSVQSSQFIGDALTLVLFNQWKVWWGNKAYIQFERWNILWPIFFLIGIGISLAVLWKYKKYVKIAPARMLQSSVLFFSLWIFVVTVYLNLLPISPRYLLILYFPIYILIPLMIQLLVKSNMKFDVTK